MKRFSRQHCLHSDAYKAGGGGGVAGGLESEEQEM